MGKLTALSLKAALKAPGRYSDGDGLLLEVTKSGSASWLVRVQKDGKRRDIGLGGLKKLGLADARERAAEIRKAIVAGRDPVAERKQRRAAPAIPTFAELAERCHGDRLKGWKNGKHRDQWISTLRTYAFPVIGDRLVSDVDTGDVLRVLLPIWLDKPETARRVRQRVVAVLDTAHALNHRASELPIRAINKALPRQPRRDGHFASMPFGDVPAFVQRLREHETFGRLCLEFAIFCAARSGEARGAQWSEIDLEAKVWRIPAARMKMEREHVVPLSPGALDVLRRAERYKRGDLIFPGQDDRRVMSDNTLLKAMRDLGEQEATPHGFRASFRTWGGESTRFPREVLEAALAHALPDKTEAAYARGTLFTKRRDLMAAWSSYLENSAAGVVRLQSARPREVSAA